VYQEEVIIYLYKKYLILNIFIIETSTKFINLKQRCKIWKIAT